MTAGADASWQDQDLNSYGVSADEVALARMSKENKDSPARQVLVILEMSPETYQRQRKRLDDDTTSVLHKGEISMKTLVSQVDSKLSET